MRSFNIIFFNNNNRRQAPSTIEALEGTSPLRLHINTAKSNAQLNDIHKAAHPTAMFYITTILSMYLFGLLLIFVHYMNSSYGKWTWTLSDVWDELTPAFFNQRYGKSFSSQKIMTIMQFLNS